MTYVRLPKVHPLHDQIAVAHFKAGLSPEESLDAVKRAKYLVRNYIVDGATIANLVRGMYLAETIKPAKKTRSPRKTKASAPVDDGIPF